MLAKRPEVVGFVDEICLILEDDITADRGTNPTASLLLRQSQSERIRKGSPPALGAARDTYDSCTETLGHDS